MSLFEALTDPGTKNILHDEVYYVKSEAKNGENFTMTGNLDLCSISGVGHGDPGYYGHVFDRLNKQVWIEVFISEKDYEKFFLDDYLAKKTFVEVCVWGKKITYNCDSTKRLTTKTRYLIFLIRPSHFIKQFDFY